MLAYLIRRLILIVPTLFGIMLINFFVIQIVPGGPVEQLLAELSGEAIEATARFRRRRLGRPHGAADPRAGYGRRLNQRHQQIPRRPRARSGSGARD